MKPSAKQLTFVYFSFVAFSIIAIHASVFYSTAENIELLYAENRLTKIKEFVNDAVVSGDIQPSGKVDVQTQGKASFDPFIQVYFDLANLPAEFGHPEQIPVGQAYEAINEETGKTFFLRREKLDDQDVLIALDNSFYELTEEQLLSEHFFQVVVSLLLGIASLFVVLRISDRLTLPISKLTAELSTRPAESLSLIPIPEGTSTREVSQLVESFNDCLMQIKALMDRERSFNRYASHELRTPLMVMKGAITLLGESKDEKFIEKQRIRLERATEEMNEFVQTLLGLTKTPSMDDCIPRRLTKQEVVDIVESHRYLLASADVECEVVLNSLPEIGMPNSAFRILLGNLIKNAFAHTESGRVIITLDRNNISITDTGIGLGNKREGYEGYGLGLLLVKDICRQFGCEFSLKENDGPGCTANIHWALRSEPRS